MLLLLFWWLLLFCSDGSFDIVGYTFINVNFNARDQSLFNWMEYQFSFNLFDFMEFKPLYWHIGFTILLKFCMKSNLFFFLKITFFFFLVGAVKSVLLVRINLLVARNCSYIRATRKGQFIYNRHLYKQCLASNRFIRIRVKRYNPYSRKKNHFAHHSQWDS